MSVSVYHPNHHLHRVSPPLEFLCNTYIIHIQVTNEATGVAASCDHLHPHHLEVCLRPQDVPQGDNQDDLS